MKCWIWSSELIFVVQIFVAPVPLVAGVQSSIDHNARESGQLVIEDPVNRGHCQWDAVTQVQLRRAVQCT